MLLHSIYHVLYLAAVNTVNVSIVGPRKDFLILN